MKTKMKLLACLLAASCSAVTLAETVSVAVDSYTFPPLIVQMPGVDVHAGQYQVRIDGQPDTAWCAEIEQFLQFGTTVEYQVLDADVVFGREIASQLDAILSYAATGHPIDARESANMQVDIWRASVGAPLSGLYNAPLTVEAFVLHNNDRQDLIVGQPYVAVDEPAPALLLALGLGLIAVGRLRAW